MTRDSRPNVVLVVLDTARADALEPYGAPTGATPAIADLARRGTTVRHAFSTANWTLPAHVSMLTGELPRSAGLRLSTVGDIGDTAWNAAAVASLAPRSLATVLGSAGWNTRGASANPWIGAAGGFAAGFEEFVSVTGTRRRAALVAKPPGDSDRKNPLTAGMATLAARAEAARGRADDGAGELHGVVRRWLADLDNTRPFFWFFNLLECHAPYLPPRAYSALGPLGRAKVSRDHSKFGSLEAIGMANCGSLEIPDSVVHRMRRAYAGAVRSADGWVAALLDELDRHGVLDDTVIMVTSDHGENLGEAGRSGHALWLDDRLVRVPLVVAGPMTVDRDAVTSLASLPRITGDGLGIADHPWQTDACPSGIAVAQSDPIADTTDPAFAAAVDEHDLDDYAIWRMTTPSTCATDGELKLVREGDDEWLYDLRADPAESTPTRLDARRALDFGDRVSRLRSATDQAAPQSRGSSRPLINDRAGASGRTSPVVDDELAARMRMLGYL